MDSGELWIIVPASIFTIAVLIMFIRWARKPASIPELKAFWMAISAAWWALMSCAAFTLLGMFAAATEQSNRWLAMAMAVMAVAMLLVASFGAWRTEYRTNRDGPDISVGVIVPFPYGKESEDHEPEQFITLTNVGKESAINIELLHADSDEFHLGMEPHVIPSLNPGSTEHVFLSTFCPNRIEEKETDARTYRKKHRLWNFLSADERRCVNVSIRFYRLGGPKFERHFVFRRDGYLIVTDTTGLTVSA